MRVIFVGSMLIVSVCRALCSPSIYNISFPATAKLYEKYEISFDVNTAAQQLYWPYDPAPAANTAEHPNAVSAGVGITVDGLFLPPGETDWNKAIRQPAFCYQKYIDCQGLTEPTWRLRFAPTAIGQWKFKIVAEDIGGLSESPVYTFVCEHSNNPGFVRVSPKDGRYFELSDGRYLPLIGIEEQPDCDLAKLAEMGINFVRSWWQGSSATGKHLFGASGQGGDSLWKNLIYSNVETYQNSLVSALVPNASSVWNGLYTQVPVNSHRMYRLSAVVKTVGIAGTGDYGVCLRTEIGAVSQKLRGDNDWTTLTLDFNSGSLPHATVSIGKENVTGGVAYCASMSLREILSDGSLGNELLIRGDFQTHNKFNPVAAERIDEFLDTAQSLGVYVRAVIEEKGDSFYGSIQADGKWGPKADANVYASETHASRVYQTYYWRYLIARYGYSTALHSVELFNEGNPTNLDHIAAVASCGRFFKQNDPNRHLVTTSNYHSFPPAMWRHPDIDIADIHMGMGYNPTWGNRIWPGWDGNWSYANRAYDPGSLFMLDESTFHTGRRSLRITVPSAPGDDNNAYATSNLWICVAAPPGHTLKFSMWFKGEGLVSYPNKPWIKPGGIALQYSQDGGDFAGYLSFGSLNADWINNEWRYTELTLTVPTEPTPEGRMRYIIWVQPYCRANNSTNSGYLWIDDVKIEDLTTGEVINYNGGFEYVQSQSYDVVAGHCAYSRIIKGFNLNKPVIRGETGFLHPLRYGDPYKGFYYHSGDGTLLCGSDQALVDDTEGIYWRKWVWAQTDAGGLHECLWFPGPLLARKFPYAKAYQRFMSDIPLSNGNYKDINAETSSLDIRVLGQKDLVNNRAHLWVDNAPYTWKAVVDHNYRPEPWSSTAKYIKDSTCGGGTPVHIYKSKQDNNVNHPVTDSEWWEDLGEFKPENNPPLPPPVSGSVTVSGFKDGPYKIEWWDTSTGTISKIEDAVCVNGKITLNVTDLQSDIACKIYPAPPKLDLRIIVPTTDVVPGQVVTVTVEYTNSGESEAREVTVTAAVPEQMEYVAGSAEASGGKWDAQTGSVSWVIDRVPAKGTGTRTFQARVK